jgi:predicted choloylglycine hydrolase
MKKVGYLACAMLALGLSGALGQGFVERQIVVGTPHDFMVVTHYRIAGTNREIGVRIAQLAKELGIVFAESDDSLRTRLRYVYFEREYPIHFQRMKGIADVYGISLNDYSRDISCVPYNPAGAGCSVVFYPARNTEAGHNTVSRNLDMPVDRKQNGLHMLSRPIVFEVYPDTGYASIYICTNDLLGGVLEGINAQGLCVTVLGNETADYSRHPPEPSYEVGLNEFQIMRYLLDNCAGVDEARQSLLYQKQFYQTFQLHYLIADNRGKSFVFQFSRHRNQSRIIGGTGIQFVTNHLIAASDSSDVPAESAERLGILRSLLKSDHTYSMDEICGISHKVSPWMPDYVPRWPSSRTLWHSVYDLEAKTVRIMFYLGETQDPASKDRVRTRYSNYVEFHLAKRSSFD